MTAATLGTMVGYKAGDETVRAYMAAPRGQGPRPGVVVIHEWWGLNDQIKGVADKIALQGYNVLVPDLYRGKVAEEPDLAHELMRGLDEERAVGIIKGAVGYLKGLRGAAAMPVDTIGFCMGGGLSLATALAGAEVQGTVMFYGSVKTSEASVAPLRAPLLGLFGDEDRGIPVDDVKKFEAALKSAGKDASIVVYPHAGHAFMNEKRPSYVPDAAKDAWGRVTEFFGRTLKPKAGA